VSFWQDPFGPNLGHRAAARHHRSATATLAVTHAASRARAMLEVLREDYIRTARAKGLLEENQSSNRHALKNALLPVVTLIGIEFAIPDRRAWSSPSRFFNLNGIGPACSCRRWQKPGQTCWAQAPGDARGRPSSCSPTSWVRRALRLARPRIRYSWGTIAAPNPATAAATGGRRSWPDAKRSPLRAIRQFIRLPAPHRHHRPW